MNDDRKRYLNKIRKLMNLANNTSSPAEAASALSKAQAFMREHGYSESEVQFSEISTSETKSAPSNAEKLPKYMTILIASVEKAMGVKALIRWRITDAGHAKRVIKFYGLDRRDVTAAYVFDVLTRLIKKARKEFQSTYCPFMNSAQKSRAANQFCDGWASGVYYAISEFIVPDEQIEKMDAYTESLRRDGLEVAKEQREQSQKGRKDSAYKFLGYVEGKKAAIFQGVDGGKTVTPQLAGGT